MSITRHRSTVFKINVPRARQYMGYSSRENSGKQDLIQDELSSKISITLMTTGSSRICLHQEIDDHHKRRKAHTEHTNKQKG